MFDFTIIGLGAAGMQLALQMAGDPFFKNKKILLLDKDRTTMPKKTWCFWEEKEGKWDTIINKKWDQATFIDKTKNLKIPLNNYRYKMLQSEIFFEYGFQEISKHKNIELHFDEVIRIEEKEDSAEVITKRQVYATNHVFDSRIPVNFFNQNNYIHIKQHFKGWFIETETPVFDDQSFTMMDFSVAHNNTTSFMYILPTSANSALLEYTFFTLEVCEEELYDKLIEKYIAEKFQSIKEYRIIKTETGVVPMSTYPFQNQHTPKVTKIGTAGGWVRASTGYSFKNAERYSAKIISNIKNNSPIGINVIPKRTLFYDRLLLDILNVKNEIGPNLFGTLFSKNKSEDAFRFLDGNTTLKEEIRVILNFPKLPFLKALFRQYLE